ncbi:hypothetical protein C8R45DRAFT_1109039 [Mycena sanguinolenta]|nr:hypothetical protein C8R45DRAFT_1109039 [Mycena sanguinolenta]
MSNCPAFADWISQRDSPTLSRPSNHTHRGFHDVSELPFGFYTPGFVRFEWDERFIDERPNADWTRHDLALCYGYEVEMEYWLGGELRVFPVIRYVYRRDPELRWQEIWDYLVHGTIPFRYPARVPGGSFGWVNEPMNVDNFKRLAARFKLRPDTNLPRIAWPFLEKHTNRPVQHHQLSFEFDFCAVIRPKLSTYAIASITPAELLLNMRAQGCNPWYLDTDSRAKKAIVYAKCCVLNNVPIEEEFYYMLARSR